MGMSKEECLNILKGTRYARIAERIEFLWDSPEAYTYFKELILSDRDNRQGFPNLIFLAILRLSNLHEGIDNLEVIKR
jgi:hypothetical protein